MAGYRGVYGLLDFITSKKIPLFLGAEEAAEPIT